VVLALMVGVFSYNIVNRIPLELTVIRDRNQLYVTTDTGAIDNIYTLRLANMDQKAHEFDITVTGIPGATMIGETSHTLDGGEVRTLTLRVRAEAEDLDKPNTPLEFTVTARGMPSIRVTSESRFMKPL